MLWTIGKLREFPTMMVFGTLCQNRVHIVCMTQDQMFHTYDQKCSQVTKCHSIEYNYYINNVFETKATLSKTEQRKTPQHHKNSNRGDA
jgi:hypothetical protein